MLCTPPAFILSQDQTLECLYLISPWRVQIISSAILASLTFVWVVFVLSEIFEFRSRTYLYACTSLFVVQFSMTVSLPRFRDSFVIISHHLLFVNTFFEIFLIFFKKCLTNDGVIGYNIQVACKKATNWTLKNKQHSEVLYQENLSNKLFKTSKASKIFWA